MRCPHTDRELIQWEDSPQFLFEPKFKILYNTRWMPSSYNENYFFEEYQQQYGKTYLEDEPHIRKLSQQRLKLLKPHLTFHSSLLELGCAFGFFLDEAKPYFSTIKGVEISSFASNYAKQRFGFDIEQKDLLVFLEENDTTFDVIASFYVIEHFSQQRRLWELISKTLSEGGLWISAIPSINGPLFVFHRDFWKKNHPIDHFVDYHPLSIKRLLEFYGLRLISLKPASYHQERTKGVLKKMPFFLYKLYCDVFVFSDTMIFIAEKPKKNSHSKS
ncbi:MAG: class I SAM-dependent methyltransferase [Leptospiraceae bacterium]|nr:class I SAM-dependent methyltransferase [Leptospiraceae bacterium]MDW7974941.1 methyltransferase domain-containing protein [Leptospiraceae bacterium]